MSKFITIVGPQSSGKTIAINHLKKKYPKWYFMETIDPYAISGHQHLGAAYSNQELQVKISEMTLIKLKRIEKLYNPVSVTEQGIGNLVYTRFFSSEKLIGEYLEKYKKVYDGLNSYIIFTDTKPEVSFERRKNQYIERVKSRGITDKKTFDAALKKYRDIIYKLYPIWVKFYDRLLYPKMIVDNSYISEKDFLKGIDKAIYNIMAD